MRRRFLHDAWAAGATQFRPHCTDHFEASRYVFQNLRDVFAERAARRFLRRLRIHCEDRQLRGKRSGCGLVRFEVFEPEFELRDIGVHLLRTLAEVHALELEDQQIQVLDFHVLGEHERLERRDIE
jgi:hypothetical protein